MPKCIRWHIQSIAFVAMSNRSEVSMASVRGTLTMLDFCLSTSHLGIWKLYTLAVILGKRWCGRVTVLVSHSPQVVGIRDMCDCAQRVIGARIGAGNCAPTAAVPMHNERLACGVVGISYRPNALS